MRREVIIKRCMRYAVAALFLLAAVPFLAQAQTPIINSGSGQAQPFYERQGTYAQSVFSNTPTSGIQPSSGSNSCGNLATGGLRGVVNCVIYIFGVIAYLIMALSVLWTMYGAFLMISSEEKRDSGKQIIYHGIIGLFVMISIWGIVNILDSTFNLSKQGPFGPPPLIRQ